MKIKAISVVRVPVFGTCSLELGGDVVVIYGGNGSGKSLICKAIGDAFRPAISSIVRSDLEGEMWSVEFEVGAEIGVISIRRGKIDRLGILKRAVRVDDVAENCVLIYGASRVGGDGDLGLGVRGIYAYLHDLHLKDMRDCVVLVDDFDMGLSVENMKRVFSHMRRNLGAKGCQLVVTVRDERFRDWCLGGGVRVIELVGEEDVLAAGLRAIRPVGSVARPGGEISTPKG